MKKIFLLLVFCMFFVVGTSSYLSALSLPEAKPEQVGMSSERLQRINTYMKDQIAKGES
jgi:hypothetical protein